MIGPRRSTCCSRHGDASAVSNIEPEVHDVAFLHQVFLALQAQLAGVARTGLAPAGEVVREGDDFGADEATLEVGMDYPRRLRRRRPDAHRPGAHFLGAGGGEGLQTEQAVGRTGPAVQTRLLQNPIREGLSSLRLPQLCELLRARR